MRMILLAAAACVALAFAHTAARADGAQGYRKNSAHHEWSADLRTGDHFFLIGQP